MTPDQQTQVKVLVPGNHLMVSLLGQRDELLRLVEGSFPVSIAPEVMRALAAAGVEARYFEIDSELGHSASGPVKTTGASFGRLRVWPAGSSSKANPISTVASSNGCPSPIAVGSNVFAKA